MKRKNKFIAFFFVGLLLFPSLAIADYIKNKWNATYDPHRIYKIKQGVNYRSGPDNKYPRIGKVNAGTKVKVVAMERGWYKIPLTNGKHGYIYKKFLSYVGKAQSSSNSSPAKAKSVVGGVPVKTCFKLGRAIENTLGVKIGINDIGFKWKDEVKGGKHLVCAVFNLNKTGGQINKEQVFLSNGWKEIVSYAADGFSGSSSGWSKNNIFCHLREGANDDGYLVSFQLNCMYK